MYIPRKQHIRNNRLKNLSSLHITLCGLQVGLFHCFIVQLVKHYYHLEPVNGNNSAGWDCITIFHST